MCWTQLYTNQALIFILLILLVFTPEPSSQLDGDTIAAVSIGKSHTRLRVIRDSPKDLMERLNRFQKGGKAEDVAHASLDFHQWTALEHDFRRQEFFIVDKEAGNLRVAVDTPRYINQTKVLYDGISSKITATAYDWIRREFYLGDPSFQAIFRLPIGRLCNEVTCMASLANHKQSKTKRRRVPTASLETVVGVGVFRPYGMTLDPIRGSLYWSDDGESWSIYTSTLEGDRFKVVVNNLIKPSGLTIDYEGNRLFWVERMSTFSTVSSCDLDLATCFPKRLTDVYSSQLYDIDYFKGSLIMADHFNRLVIYDEETNNLLRQHWLGKAQGVNICSKDKQKYKDGPAFQPHHPQDGYVFSDVTRRGLVLLASEKSGILMVERTFSMGSEPSAPYLFLRETGITTMAVDIPRKQLYFFKRSRKTIYRVTIPANIDASHQPVVTTCITSWVDDVTAMAVDWSTGNLYWLDSGYRRIMMSDSLGRHPSVIHYNEIVRPQDMVIHSEKKLLFWSDMNDVDPRIERSRLDGGHRMTILGKNDFYERPSALALDLQRDRLYWSDGPFLCRATLTGRLVEDCKPRDIMSRPAIKAIDIMHDYVLWSDFNRGVRAADTDGEFPLSSPKRGDNWFSDSYYSDVLYFHTSKQPEVENTCRKHGLYPEPLYGRRNISFTLEDAVKFYRQKERARTAPESSGTSNYVGGENSPMRSYSRCTHLCIPTMQLPKCACGVGYWKRHDGECVPGVTRDYVLVMADVPTGKVFRQFSLLPHYYVVPMYGDTQAFDVTLDEDTGKPGRERVNVSRYHTDYVLVMADVPTGKVFRQFSLLPHYYVVPMYGDTQAFDVTLDEDTGKLFWLDNRPHTNMILTSGYDGEDQSIVLAGTEFGMTSITAAFNLLYILTSTGHVTVLCLTSGIFTEVIDKENVIVNSIFVDKQSKYLYLSASRKIMGPKHTVFVLENTERILMRSKLDGTDLRTVYRCRGKPMGLAVHGEDLYWIDMEQKEILTIRLTPPTEGSDNLNTEGHREPLTPYGGNDNHNHNHYHHQHHHPHREPRQTSFDTPLIPNTVQARVVLQLEATSKPKVMVITPDGDIYFTDDTKQSPQHAHVRGTVPVEDAAFPYLNKIGGIAYYDARNKMDQSALERDRERCAGMAIPIPGGNNLTSCLCDSGSCKNRMNPIYRITAREQGLCPVTSIMDGEVKGSDVNTYVMSGQDITVTCTPGYNLTYAAVSTEKRRCNSGTWNSTAECRKALGYLVNGNSSRGYVVFMESMPFYVPRDVRQVDVIAIGGGGGGYDPCDHDLFGTRSRAGMGGMSKFGYYLRAHGGFGGSAEDGGRGGRSRSLFGGRGSDSSACLGGGAAGETRSPEICRLGSTSCTFCGAGGALVTCNKCPVVRPGGCSGTGSTVQGREAADNFGGGATGVNGGWGGGGGGYSRKSVWVSPYERVEVKVGRRGFPSSRPPADGVVVVAWGDVIENLVTSEVKPTICKTFEYDGRFVPNYQKCETKKGGIRKKKKRRRS